jgi:uncharacterized protein YndB with AHSA1/START domain
MSTPTATIRADSVVHAAIEIAAPPEDVFDALTNPRELAAWLGGTDDAAEAEWAPDAAAGTSWSAPAIAPDGAMGLVRGEFLVVDAPRRLVSTWHASWDHYARTIVRYELEPVEVEGRAGTRVTVIHSAPAACAPHASLFGATRDGWTLMLARLARLMSERLTV